MRIASIVGARPQFVKLAPIAHAAAGRDGVEHIIVHTGQHYDEQMSDTFFAELDIPEPDWNLEVGSGPHGAQTGLMLTRIEEVLDEVRPDWTLVYGDTNSTIAGALAATKMHLAVAHLEAGLRSRRRTMPEEVNRVLTDHASDLLLAPTQTAMTNLAAEGLAGRSHLVGDVMVDALYATRDALLAGGGADDRVDPEVRPVLATLHRAENTDDEGRLRSIIHALQALPVPVVLPVHPRLANRCHHLGIMLDNGSLTTVEPLGRSALVRELLSSRSVVTDSGGLQKEAQILGIPCTTIRTETEWPETLEGGWNVLVSHLRELEAAVLRDAPAGAPPRCFGDGHAAEAVIELLFRSVP